MQINQNWQFDIQLDSGIVLSNVNSVIECGANDIVIGSSIFSKNAIEENLKAFCAAIKGK
jgi:ribulose-phosphate 3-epimerase